MKLKVGIIGLGVGEEHIRGYESHPNCEVVALCDFNDEVFLKAKNKYSRYKITKEANDILDDSEIDIVSIASWENYHHNQILRGINNDKHMFIEKPICLSEQEALDIIEALDCNPDIKISSNLILRKSARFIELRKMIQNGELGDLSYMYGAYNYGRVHKITEGWRGKIDFYSVVYGGGIHIIDLMLWLTGSHIIEVASFGNNIQTKETQFRFNDMVVTILKFKKGMIGTLSSNYGCVFPHFHQFEVYGTKGTFVNGLRDAKLYKTRGSKSYEVIKTAYPGIHKGDLIYNFVESILNGTEPEVSRQDIFEVMAVCFAIEKAAVSGAIEKVNSLFSLYENNKLCEKNKIKV